MRSLRRFEASDEHAAGERTWETVRRAFAEREALPAHRPLRPALALAALLLAALVAAAASPPGRALIDTVREAVGVTRVEEARPALASIPGGGSLLVSAQGGTWVIQADGSRRRIGRHTQAVWSPRGLFVAAVERQTLSALEPDGDVRWSLAREPGVAWPRWSPSGYRIAYKAGETLRLVAGDGTGDRELAAPVRFDVPALAWHPAPGRHLLTYADPQGRIRLLDTDRDETLWATAPRRGVRQLAWSPDGSRLLALGDTAVDVHDRDGRRLASIPTIPGPGSLAFSRRADHSFALARRTAVGAATSEIVLLRAEAEPGQARELFTGTGIFHELAWSPGGAHVLATWPSADQWLFLRTDDRGRRIEAVSDVTAQLGEPGAVFPVLGGWCCPRSP